MLFHPGLCRAAEEGLAFLEPAQSQALQRLCLARLEAASPWAAWCLEAVPALQLCSWLGRVEGPLRQSLRQRCQAQDPQMLDLAGLWAWTELNVLLGESPSGAWREAPLAALQRHRAKGGYSLVDQDRAGLYGSWLAAGLLQRLGRLPEEADLDLDKLVRAFAAADGAYAHVPGSTHGTVPASFFALELHLWLGEPPPAHLGLWLSEQSAPEGGFMASSALPLADAMSTCLALRAMEHGHLPLSEIAWEETMEFLRDLQAVEGGFIPHARTVRAEAASSFYALAAIGILSRMD